MAKSEEPAPIFFAKPAEFRRWLAKHHASARELWVGFHRKATARPSLTWPESVDEALCVGWIDGLRKTVDLTSYKIRFTPRKKTSSWSLVNIRRVAELEGLGRMRPAGRKAFAERAEAKSGIYAYEQRQQAALDPVSLAEFRRHPAAWKFFEAQPPGYREVAAWWVISAKQEATRRKRLVRLIEDSAVGKRLQ
ncbi:MAG: YdeI/OmpD-associated family protein [Verrucomicrobiota bacterium]|nr:YdeI/OmpD-associated family protein [Verrucomicrobiota bacterium]